MNPPQKPSLIKKRSLNLAGHKTSIGLEDDFWLSVRSIATQEGVTPSQLIARINADRHHGNLSSAIRLYVLNHYRRLAEEAAPGGGKAKR
jgi:predicted DNA-binding ribbon-helix-helix protein